MFISLIQTPILILDGMYHKFPFIKQSDVINNKVNNIDNPERYTNKRKREKKKKKHARTPTEAIRNASKARGKFPDGAEVWRGGGAS